MTAASLRDHDAARAFQERMWIVTRIGWLAMVAIVLAAAFGLSGKGGPLSRQHLVAGAAEIDVPRVARWSASDTMSISFERMGAGEVEVVVPHAFGDVFAIEAISPQPASGASTTDGAVYRFEFAGA